MKDHREIRKLLDRYFAAETNRKEEAELRAYFQGSDVEESLETYRPLFQILEQEKNQQLPETFDQEFWAAAGSRKPATRRFLPPQLTWMLRVAAVVLLLSTVIWLWPETTHSAQAEVIDWSQYEPETPEEALQIYQQAAFKLGAALNKGTSSAAEKVKRIEDIGQFFK